MKDEHSDVIVGLSFFLTSNKMHFQSSLFLKITRIHKFRTIYERNWYDYGSLERLQSETCH